MLNAEEKYQPILYQCINHAKRRLVDLGELSEQEAESIGSYLQRDIEDATQFMSLANKRFQEWLALDWLSVETTLFDTCRQVADQTVIEWQRLRQRLPLRSLSYHSGEITGIGSLQCKNCQQILQFSKTSRIPPCPKCHKTEFLRLDVDRF